METLTLKKNIVSDFNGCVCDSQDIYLRIQLKKVYHKVLKHELNIERVKRALRTKNSLESSPKVKMKKFTNFSNSFLFKSFKNRFVQSLFTLIIIIIAIYFQRWDHFIVSRCAVANNYFVMEVTRPVTNCDICRNVDQFLILENVTKETFAKYAYTGQPVLVRGATNKWLALKTFNFDFFRRIYSEIPDAYQSVEEECQFFPFKTEFNRLSEVFSMPEERINMSEPYAKPWYIGWSNCNPQIAQILRQHYNRPTFLPDDSESSAIDWIFMGYSQRGASMHLDYVQRPSWQAQISGSKTWHLLPPPECEKECKAINITVNKGDIILIDTNQWYHDTHINAGEISVTIGSEYD